MSTNMNVFQDKEKLLVWIPEADLEIKYFYATVFAGPEIGQEPSEFEPHRGAYLFARNGNEAISISATNLRDFIDRYDHAVTRILRAVLAAERAARRDGVPQAVTYRGGPTPTAFYGPATFRRPGEPWVEIAPDGIAVWHNEEG